MLEPEVFGLYPKRHTHICNGVCTVFRAFFIDVLEDRFDIMTEKIAGAFTSGDFHLDGIQLIPLQPTTTFSLKNIKLAVQKQNGYQANIAHMMVRGIKHIDLEMTTLSGSKQTIRGFF